MVSNEKLEQYITNVFMTGELPVPYDDCVEESKACYRLGFRDAEKYIHHNVELFVEKLLKHADDFEGVVQLNGTPTLVIPVKDIVEVYNKFKNGTDY